MTSDIDMSLLRRICWLSNEQNMNRFVRPIVLTKMTYYACLPIAVLTSCTSPLLGSVRHTDGPDTRPVQGQDSRGRWEAEHVQTGACERRVREQRANSDRTGRSTFD